MPESADTYVIITFIKRKYKQRRVRRSRKWAMQSSPPMDLCKISIFSWVSFLWVLKPPGPETGRLPHVLPEGFMEKVGDKGKIVQWSPQEEVLAHRSTACFVTHCGWNSTMETLASGVPVVAFPQWGDQVTDAKFLVDVFKVGIRLCRGAAEGSIVPRKEVERCLREATGGGPKAAEMKENALKWKKAAAEAVAYSYRNMKDFVDEIVRMRASRDQLTNS
ncbi:cinnamate beta-D-glucosyltransferase-like [Primulina huaijiensis]|uniref:cinnamate beta-D-glucosyltransferase-like n=1 Tax=Primulina huaijiensis TaxID=1492673 RepID=UPI003CC768EB